MKKLIALVMALSMIFAMAACTTTEKDSEVVDATGKTSETTSTATNDEAAIPASIKDKQLKFMLIHEIATGTSGSQLIAGFTNACEELGIEAVVSDANGSQEKMVSILDAAVNQHVDAIIINNGRADALTPGVKRAIEAGIVVITKDVDLGLEGVPTVDQDDYFLSLLSVKQMIADINGTGNIVRGFAAGFVPQERRYDMSKLYLSRYPDIKEVAEFGPVSSSTALDSQTKMEAILKQFPEEGSLAAVWCGWEEWAKGACKAIVEAGRQDEIKVYSTDMSDELLQMLQDPTNPYTATAAIDIAMMGEVCVRMALCKLADESVPQYYSFSSTLVQKSDLPADIAISTSDLGDYVPGWGENDDFRPAWMETLKATVK